MSCVICLSTESFAFIAGDGRAKDVCTGQIIDEHYKKVIQINPNVIMGFTGTDIVCMGAINVLPSNVNALGITEISEILCRNAKKIHESTGESGSFILAGVENGKIIVSSFGRDGKYTIDRREPHEGDVFFNSLYPEAITHDIFYECYCEFINDGLSRIIKETFRRVAEQSDTVNQNISLLTVEIPSAV